MTASWNRKMLAEGRCYNCGQPREQLTHYCNGCQAKRNEALRRRRQRRREAEGRTPRAPIGRAPIIVPGRDWQEIPLTQGYVAIVDTSDVPLVSACNWAVLFKGKHRRHKYAKGHMAIDGKKRYVEMHRLIAGFPEGMEVDHRDGNGLNNRRSNLRVATTAQNQANQRRGRGASRYKGVQLAPKGKFRARITHHQKRFQLGTFSTEEAAARAYDDAARKLWGEFAGLNF